MYKRTPPKEIIHDIRTKFISVWEYDPSFECLMEEIDYEIDRIYSRSLRYLKEYELTGNPESKELIKSLMIENSVKLADYLEALETVKRGKYE